MGFVRTTSKREIGNYPKRKYPLKISWLTTHFGFVQKKQRPHILVPQFFFSHKISTCTSGSYKYYSRTTSWSCRESTFICLENNSQAPCRKSSSTFTSKLLLDVLKGHSCRAPPFCPLLRWMVPPPCHINNLQNQEPLI